ncbi:MAG: O-acetyl-ADP-ribose deacetylase [Petrimonas sp.]|jgi:O-acetyl-ADP-ribose deacetylase (regulator of RNase III)|nr:O-acetyl-ADP-ribose deacetylase [Petrimonas sp.]
MNTRIELIKDDITTLDVDAIVNAANQTLRGGGGVDGAIHRAAGRELLQACIQLDGCETGHAKITPGFRLPAKYVIHTVGPVWRDGKHGEPELLRSCYVESLNLATIEKCNTIVFPNISTGVYRFPKEQAAAIAIEAVRTFLEEEEFPQKVIFCCFDDENYEIYEAACRG